MLKIENDALLEGEHDHLLSVEDGPSEHTSPLKHNTVDFGQRMYLSQSTSTDTNICTEEFFSEETLTQAKRQDMVVYLNDDTCENVKDIRIDEGVYSIERTLRENGGEKISSSFDCSLMNGCDDFNKGIPDGDRCIVHDSNSKSISGPLISVFDRRLDDHYYGSVSDVGGRVKKIEQTVDDSFYEKISSKHVFPVEDSPRAPQNVYRITFNWSSEPQLSVDRQAFDKGAEDKCTAVETIVYDNTGKPNQCSWIKKSPACGSSESMSEEFYSATPVQSDSAESYTTANVLLEGSSKAERSAATSLSSDSAESIDEVGNVNSVTSLSNCRLEGSIGLTGGQHGSRVSDKNRMANEHHFNCLLSNDLKEHCSIAEDVPSDIFSLNIPPNSESDVGADVSDFDSRAADIIRIDGRQENRDNQLATPAQTDHIVEESVPDVMRTSTRRSINHNHEDMNFSDHIISSGPITSSGYIPYSGSISLRSDSSTTSTRSFAFPILQTEWNCSPVKMVKADRRHFRKHRGWRMRILCCRF